MSSFDAFWEYLQKNLKPGTEIRNWTVDKGYLGDVMTIKIVTGPFIEVEVSSAKNIQRVPREHFEIVFAVWKDYVAKIRKRSDVRDMTRFSKYIISIIRWSDREISNSTPKQHREK
jgi:hypothetical protein